MEGIALEILGPPRLSKLVFFISPYGLPPYQLFSYEPALDQLAVESSHPPPSLQYFQNDPLRVHSSS